MDDSHGRGEYIRHLLDVYRKTPATTGTSRRPDRILAAQLHQGSMAFRVIENTSVRAAAPCLMRLAGAPPLARFARIFPVIDDVIGLRLAPDYLRHSCQKFEQCVPAR